MDDEMGNPRKGELAACSEEELLAMQDEFCAQQRRPAANVVRVSRWNGSGAQLQAYCAPHGAIALQRTQGNQLQNSYPVQSSTAVEGRKLGLRVRDVLPGLGNGGGSGGPKGNIRGDEDLTLSTEEELLRMQEDFIAQNSRPAAKCTRITRRGPPAPSEVPVAITSVAALSAPSSDGSIFSDRTGDIRESQAPRPVNAEDAAAASVTAAPLVSQYGNLAEAVKGGARPFPKTPDAAVAAVGSTQVEARQRQHREHEPTSILGPIEGLLGDIVERQPAPAQPPTTPVAGPVMVRDVAPFPGESLPLAGTLSEDYRGAGASFPEAMHRRQSKFALSRKAKQHSQSREQQPAANNTASLPPAVPHAAPALPGGATRAPLTASALSNWSVLPSGPVSTTATSAAQHDAALVENVRDTVHGGGGGDATGELGAIGEQNLEAVASMRPEEVAAALEELSSRMTPGALEFLRQRGAQRLAQRQQPQSQSERLRSPALGRTQAQAPAPSSGANARLTADLVRLAPGRGAMSSVLSMASCATQQDSNAVIDTALRALTAGGGSRLEGGGHGDGGPLLASVAAPGNLVGSLPIGALVTAQQQQQQQQQEGKERQQGSGGRSGGVEAVAGQGVAAAVATPAAESSSRGSPADPRLVARLRFDVDGAVVDVQGLEEVFVEEEVLLRDQLRRDEGSVPPGYTLGELLVLCRSMVAAQRVAGLTAIADLAATARPRPEDLQMYAPTAAVAAAASSCASATTEDGTWSPGQMMRRFVPIPEQLRNRAPAYSVSWQEVWQFFVSELGLVAHLRLALDDDRPAVLAAAAAALVAVLGRSEAELLAAEMADACPSTGWPTAAGGYLTRHGITAPWEAAAAVQPPPPVAAGAAPPGVDDEPDAPEDVALVDPLGGALQMGLLQRIRYLLAARHAPAAVLPLLAVLCAAARAGSETALAVAKEPGLLAAVGALLDPAAAAATAAAGAAAAGGVESAAVQVAALMLVRLLCCSSSLVSHLVRSAGLLAHVPAYALLGAPGGGGDVDRRRSGDTVRTALDQQIHEQTPSEAAVSLQLLRLEALRIWRACAHHGIFLASLDDLYGNLCHLLPPPLSSSPRLPVAAATVRQLTAAEMYLLLAALIRHSFAVASGDATIGRSMLSPGAAAVIATEALAWLRPASLTGAAIAAVTRCYLSVPLLSAAPVSRGNVGDAGAAAVAASGTGPSGGLLRALFGAHPAVLLPTAAAHVACLAAVASFLTAYWSTVAVAAPASAPVRLALDASGLLLHQLTGADSRTYNTRQQQQAEPAMSATDELAIELLRIPQPAEHEEITVTERAAKWQLREPSDASGSTDEAEGQSPGNRQAHGSSVGRALAEWALAAVGGTCVVAPTVEKTAGGLRLGALAQACLQAAAASLLYSVLQLTAAVYRDSPAVAAGPLAANVLSAAAPLCCQAAAAIPAMVGRVLCPWHAAAMQRQLHLTRLMLLSATLLPPAFYQPHNNDCSSSRTDIRTSSFEGGVCGFNGHPGTVVEHPTSSAEEEEEEEERQRLQMLVLEGCLAALSASPPGAEDLCLQALRLALREVLLLQPLQAAHAAAAELTAANAKLALAAAGVPYTTAFETTNLGTAAPFPLPDVPPLAAQVADVLFESYAASWLSLVSQRRLAAGSAVPPPRITMTQPTRDALTGFPQPARGSPLQPPLPRLDPLDLIPTSLQGQQGSRLPAPGQWAMLEAHRLPYQAPECSQHQEQGRLQKLREARRPDEEWQQQEQGQGQEDNWAAQIATLHPVGCALMLCLGREVNSSSLQEAWKDSRRGGSGSSTLQWLSAGAKAQAALQAVYLFRVDEMVPRDADEVSEGSWRDPYVRWALAGLSHRYLFGRDGSQARPPGPPGPEWLPPALLEQLISALGSTCFGDPLLAAHLALVLARDASPVVRLQAWNGLASEKSLHLLPPLSRCLGTAAQYLGPPPFPAAAAAAQHADIEPDLSFLAAVQRSLVEGDLDRALEPTGATADPAPLMQGGEPASAATRTTINAATAAVATTMRARGCVSVAGDVALQLLANYLLQREQWPVLERAWNRSVSRAASSSIKGVQSYVEMKGGGEPCRGARNGPAGGDGASPGAAMLMALVGSARPELVAQIVLMAEVRCCVRREDVAMVLAQTCGADVTLRERVRHVLALCGVV